MKKKLYIAIFAVVTAVCAGTATCSADANLTARPDADGITTVKVVTDTKAPNYLLYILKPGTAADEMVNSDGTLQGLYKLEQLKEGSPINAEYDLYTYSFSADAEDVPGEYRVIAVGGDLDFGDKAAQTRFVISTPEDEAKALTAVAAAPTEATLREYQGKVWYVDFENEVYQANKSEVLASFAEIGKNPNCGGDVQQAFETACALTGIKYASSSQIYRLLFAYEELLGVDYCKEVRDKDDGFLKSFTDLRADKTANPLRTTAELNKLLRNAEGLSRVNAAKRETVIDVLREYEDVFGLSETLKGVNDYAIAKEILATTGNEYTSVAQVVTAVKTSVEKQTSDSNKPSYSASGGRGTGGGISVEGVNYTDSATRDTMNNISPNEGNNSVFRDLQGAEWAEAYIEYMNYAGIMTGDGNGSFRPTAPISREEFAKALLSALKITAGDNTAVKQMSFSDVDTEAWYYETAEIAYQTGIVNGIDDVSFGVGLPITRQDAAAMLTRARNVAKLAFRRMSDTVEFADQGNIAGYAVSAVIELQKAGVLSGYDDGTFKPQNHITRAETAKILYEMLNGLGKL